jgi:hypothetical protein
MSFIHNGRQSMRPVNSDNFLSSRARNYGYYPLIKDNTAPAFNMHIENKVTKKQSPVSIANEVYISAEDLLDEQRPLVIAFVGASNNTTQHIKALKSLEADIQVMGGRLLVLSGLNPRRLQQALKHFDGLTVFYDRDNTIAELFGLYDAANPLWQWVAGVEHDDASLPAFYVLSEGRKIVYHHIDYSLSLYTGNAYNTQPFIRELLTSVYNTAQQRTYQPIQYKSVS